jgi:hypothetical protein
MRRSIKYKKRRSFLVPQPYFDLLEMINFKTIMLTKSLNELEVAPIAIVNGSIFVYNQ